MPHVAGLVGEEQVIAGELLLIPGAKRGVGRRHRRTRGLEQLGEADVLMPQRLALARVEGAHEVLVEPDRRVRDDRHRPEHEYGVERRVGSAGRVVTAGVLGKCAHDALVHGLHGPKHPVGLRAVAEEDPLEHRAGVRDPPEGRGLAVGVLAGSHVVQGLDGADAQRALSVHQADGLLFVHPPQK